MKDLNMFIATGRLGKAPELKTTQTGKNFVDFSIANNQDYGETEHTVWVDCRAWGAIADLICKYCTKGTKVNIVGTLDRSQWTNQDGSEADRTFVNVREFYFAESRRNDDDANGASNAAPQRQQQVRQPAARNAAPTRQAPQRQQQYAPTPYEPYDEFAFNDSEF